MSNKDNNQNRQEHMPSPKPARAKPCRKPLKVDSKGSELLTPQKPLYGGFYLLPR